MKCLMFDHESFNPKLSKKKINKDSYLDLNTLKKKDITKVKIDNITLFPFLKRFYIIVLSLPRNLIFFYLYFF